MQLVQRLLEKGLLSEADIPRISEAQAAAPGKPVHEVLLEKGFVKEEHVLAALAEEFGMDLVDLTNVTVEPETLQAMPLKLVHRRSLMPLSRQNGTLVVATGDPYDVYALDELQTLTGLHVQSVLASPREIARLIKTHFGVGGETVSAMVQERAGGDGVELLEELELDDSEAAKKIMARLNIAEKRLPQDGRIKMRVQNREIDVRVSIIPMAHGEGIVMRLLDKGRMVFNLANVGMLPDNYKTFKQLIDLPHGIILVTGPTGSGKSTTLYSALNEIKDETLKIITVEDPVEYVQEGISQIQVHSKIGLTFAASLRSILRHDPDVILIGEMRDQETAQSAIQASLTGHLVFSTLHTNDAPSAFTRLIDMGIEPFLVASTVEGVMAQRLVRTICPECKVEYHPAIEELPIDFPLEDRNAGPVPPLWKGAGCRACRQSGYRGRTGIYELMVTNDVIRELVVSRTNANLIRAEAMRFGMRTLRQDGWRKVLQGTTTIEEVARTTAGDIS
jgi:general secretion pathway protein E/type IV pilus assembly protein PilB